VCGMRTSWPFPSRKRQMSKSWLPVSSVKASRFFIGATAGSLARQPHRANLRTDKHRDRAQSFPAWVEVDYTSVWNCPNCKGLLNTAGCRSARNHTDLHGSSPGMRHRDVCRVLARTSAGLGPLARPARSQSRGNLSSHTATVYGLAPILRRNVARGLFARGRCHNLLENHRTFAARS
jgi:hypothetical protein